MQRIRQSLDDILDNLSELPSVWKDELAERIIKVLHLIPTDRTVNSSDIRHLLDGDFDASLHAFRLFLDCSKDELENQLRTLFPDRIRPTKNGFKKDPESFVGLFEETGILEKIEATKQHPVTWIDVLSERLKGGRGSAIKGQRRGRSLEDFIDDIVAAIFGDSNYDARCSFLGKNGTSTAKCDFAIPSRESPSILIEVKAFGATGSKQTNVIGDARSIRDEKRHDTTFIVVTDGVTWRARTSDLKELVRLQNERDIYRIYTKAMASGLREDLEQMKLEYGL